MKIRPLLLFIALSAGVMSTLSCGSLDSDSWGDVAEDYQVGSVARVSGGLGTAFYRQLGSRELPDAILRTGEQITLLEVGESWSRVRNEERGIGWVSTLEIVPLSE